MTVDPAPGRLVARRRRWLAVLAAALLTTGCTPVQGSTSPAKTGTSRALASTSPAQASTPAAAAARRPSKLLVVVLENRAASEVPRQMPYLSAQGRRYGTATRYFAVTHPSLPNYLTMAGGSTFGVRDDDGPSEHRLRGSSVFGQALAHHRTARTYAEGMRASCQRHDTGRYAVRHNPWTYFPRERAACRRQDVPAGTPKRGALHNDVRAGRLPNVGMLVPDVCNDAHDCSLARSDRWLRSWLPALQAGPDWRAGRLALLVTFDEDDHSARNHIAAVLMYPSLHGKRVSRRMDHQDLSASASRLAGGLPLRGAAGRAGILAAFGLA